jgi:CBS domain-containing protein
MPRLDRVRARATARRLVGPVLVGAGFVLTLGGNAMGGLAFVLAGWMARAAVRAGDRRDRLQGLLDGVTVADAMEASGPTVAPHVTLDAFVPELDTSPDVGAVRVVADGALVGIVGPREVSRVPRSRWAVVRAGEAMTATASLPGLAPEEPLGPAAERLGASGATGWPVVADGRPVGILTRTAVGRALQVRLQGSSLGRAAAGPPAAVPGVPESGDAVPEPGDVDPAASDDDAAATGDDPPTDPAAGRPRRDGP